MNASTKIVKTSKVKFELLFKIVAIVYLVVLTTFSAKALSNIHFIFAFFLITLEFFILSVTWKAARDKKKNPWWVIILVATAWMLCAFGIKTYLDQHNEINGTLTTTDFAPRMALVSGNLEELNTKFSADQTRKINLEEEIVKHISVIKQRNEDIAAINEKISKRMLSVSNCSKSADCTTAVNGFKGDQERIDAEIAQTEHMIASMRREVQKLEESMDSTSSEAGALKTNLSLLEEEKISQAASTEGTGNAFIKTLKQVLTPIYTALGAFEVKADGTVATEVTDKQAWNVLNWFFGFLSYIVYFALLSLSFPAEPKAVSTSSKVKGGAGKAHNWFMDTFFETEEIVEVKHPLA